MKTNIGKLLESAIHHRNSGGEFVLAGSPEHAMPALVMALTDSLLATALLELSSQRRTRDRDAVADARREKIDALLEEAIPVFRAQLERVSAEPHAAPPGYGMEGSPTCYACGVDASAVLELMGAVSTVVAHARIGEDPPADRYQRLEAALQSHGLPFHVSLSTDPPAGASATQASPNTLGAISGRKEP